MRYLVAIVVLVVIIFIVMRARAGRESIANADDIVIQFDKVKKSGGNIFDFRKAIGDPNFSPYKYAQLATLYKNGQITVNNVTRVLAPE